MPTQAPKGAKAKRRISSLSGQPLHRSDTAGESFSPAARSSWPPGLLLFALTVLAYIPSMGAGFVWDDDLHILNNIITKPTGLWRSWFTVEQPNYWPLTWSAFWAEWKLFGMNPTGYHVVNILVHGANALLAWRVLRHLAIPGAWMAALLFALHPVNVETAAWITQLKTLLSMFLFLLSLLAFLRSGEGEGARRRVLYGGSVALFLAALLAKPAVVTMPVLLLGLAWWRQGKVTKGDLLRTLPFFLVAGLLSATEIWFQYTRSIAGADVRNDSFLARLAGAGWVVGFYLSKALLPLNLMTIYPRWRIDPLSLLTWVPNLLLAAGAVVAWKKRFSWGRALLAAMGYFVITLLPVLGFLNIFYMRYSFVADHYQYVSVLGITALLAGGGAWLAPKLEPLPRRLLIGAAACLVALFTVQTIRLQGDYRDLETFYRHALRKNPDAWLARNNLGHLLLKKGNLQEARLHFTEALRIEPSYAENYANLGSVLAAQGQMDEAMAHFRKASELTGDLFEPHNRLGETYLRLGRIEEAVAEFEKALVLEPGFATAHDNLGLVAMRRRDYPRAIEHFTRAVNHAPRFVQAHEHLAEARLRSGDEAGAFAAYREAIKVLPESPELRNNLAATLAQTGRIDEAIGELREALRLAPGFAPTRKNLGALLARQGKREEAVRELHEALRLDPRDREAMAVLDQLAR